MKKYNPAKIEQKWQKVWQESGIYKTTDRPQKPYYNLVMFPYPSGDLHVGHWSNFAPADSLARFARMNGRDVLSPIGFDAFGLPAENAAIKRGLAADEWTDENITRMIDQLKAMGAMYDWDKTVNTSQPGYYRWTQWLFLQFFKAGQAYQAKGLVNWCPSCRTVLANEQVVDGKCERCGTLVERKNLKQWYLKTTDYADQLLKGLDKLDWPEKIKTMQRNWIGKSQGALIKFYVDAPGLQITASEASVLTRRTSEYDSRRASSLPGASVADARLGEMDISSGDEHPYIEVFTTRPDTLFGATFLVIAPEHPLVDAITTDDHRLKVQKYVEAAGSKTDVARQEETQKTGVFTGRYAASPVNGEQVPIWIADYVLMSYGTGAIMAVPAHDERDWEFAKQYGLEIRQVIDGGDDKKSAHAGDGKLINSGEFDGMTVANAKTAITAYLQRRNKGQKQVQYRLRDWLISRQRYWGTPIPIIHCSECGAVPVPEDELPVVLPLKQKFDESGRSPLLDHPDFVEVKCPGCGGQARRETDTMDTFVDSSWYFLRYPNPNYDKGPFDPVAVKTWLPVDCYIGGAEHAVLHLLYARYFTMFLRDQKLLDFDEPFAKLINQGIILGPDGAKMSKSKGNVIDPDDYVAKYGADAVRLYLMFMGPYEDEKPWDADRFEGTYRFIRRTWELISTKYDQKSVDTIKETELVGLLHKTLKKVGDDISQTKFNTAIAALMEFVNAAGPMARDGVIDKTIWHEICLTLTLMLAPLAPHLAEELWLLLGLQQSVHLQGWPEYDSNLIKDDMATIVIQVNGKKKGQFTAVMDTSPDQLEARALEENKRVKYTRGVEIVKIIVVTNRLVNLVTKS